MNLVEEESEWGCTLFSLFFLQAKDPSNESEQHKIYRNGYKKFRYNSM